MLRSVLTGRNVTLTASLLVAVIMTCGLPLKLYAQQDAEKKAAALLDKYVEVTGGKAAYDAIKNRVVSGEVSIPAMEITLKMTVHSAEPNKFHTMVETPSGAMERGSDGKVVWMIVPGMGPRVLEGAEKVSTVRDSTQDRFAEWKKLCSKVEYMGEEDVDGAKCAKIKMTYKQIDPKVKETPTEILIDPKTNLIVQWSSEVTGPQGKTPVVVTLGDYKAVSGVKFAHKMTVKAGGIEQVVKFDSIKCNTDIPADKFVLPKDVQELLKK